MKLLRTKYAVSTIYNVIGHLRRILDYCRDHGAPKIPIKRIKPRNRGISPSEEELAQMYAAALPWERAWLILQAEIGLRIGEARQVCDATHDVANRTVTVIGKGKQPRTLPTTDQLETLFALAPKAEATTPLIDRLSAKHQTTSTMSKAWRRLLSRAGVRECLHPHDLRRRAATQTYERTKDLRAAQELLGHQTLTSTLHYLAHYEPHALRPLIEALRIPTETQQ